VKVTAYVPCWNNRSTIRQAVSSVLDQTTRPAEVIVVDDGSTDGATDRLAGLHVRVIRHEQNLGRGGTRARAMAEATHDIVLSCDATVVLDRRFLEKALPWFDDARVGGVFGRPTQGRAETTADRWRGRHLFKSALNQDVAHFAPLATGGAVVRRSAAVAVGGYDAARRHSEDSDLGARLIRAGFDVVQDPALEAMSIASNTVGEVLERYWRWYAGHDEAVSWRGYLKGIGYSVKGMAAADLAAGDPFSVPVSLLAPHYQFWRSLLRRARTGPS
jgi:glycosyltransferase involved in cell wall biosynthesis